jgi:hypothetical protein
MRQVLGCALFRPPQAAKNAAAGPRAATAAAGADRPGSSAAAEAARSGASMPPVSPRLVATMPSPRLSARRTTSEGAMSLEEAAIYATAHLSSKRLGN